MVPIVQIDRDRKFLSPTLSGPALERMASAFRSASRWRDRWKNANFQAAVRDVLHESGGLILFGTEMPFQAPPPFNEMFEPIEIGSGRGGNAADLDVLSEDSQASLRRLMWLRWGIAGFGILLAVVPILFIRINRIPVHAISIVVLAFALCGMAVFALTLFVPNRDRWFIIPGALAIQHRPTRRNRDPGVTVLTPKNACLILRHVESGSTVTLVLELWSSDESIYRCAVTERESMGILAAWQSSHAPPTEDRLRELT
jgi:hypothetical protein